MSLLSILIALTALLTALVAACLYPLLFPFRVLTGKQYYREGFIKYTSQVRLRELPEGTYEDYLAGQGEVGALSEHAVDSLLSDVRHASARGGARLWDGLQILGRLIATLANRLAIEARRRTVTSRPPLSRRFDGRVLLDSIEQIVGPANAPVAALVHPHANTIPAPPAGHPDPGPLDLEDGELLEGLLLWTWFLSRRVRAMRDEKVKTTSDL